MSTATTKMRKPRAGTHASVKPSASGARKGADAGAKKFMPEQVVLALQGGGALGAFQAGAYQALHEAGIEPDWVIGTSIGAINSALIVGNPAVDRSARLDAFWQQMARHGRLPWLPGEINRMLGDMGIFVGGLPGFFRPAAAALMGQQAKLGVERAAYYDTAPLRKTLSGLVEPALFNSGSPRLSVGAVNARSGQMRYFDSRNEALGIDHIMASGALPPAFPAVRIDGEPYWDGGIYSNTSIESVLDDNPRRSSLIFAVNLWPATGSEPGSIAEVLSRYKDIQYASRANSHITRQKQIHRLRHVIRALGQHLPPALLQRDEIKQLTAYGCPTTMHVVMLTPPHVQGDTATKDIDFSAASLRARREAGYAQTREMLEKAPWNEPSDPLEGVIVHLP